MSLGIVCMITMSVCHILKVLVGVIGRKLPSL